MSLGLLLQISVFFGDLVLLRFLLAHFPHLVSSSPAESIKFRCQAHVTFPSCVGAACNGVAAFHLLVPKPVGFPCSLQILQSNDVAAHNSQNVQGKLKQHRPSAKNFLCLILQQDPRLLDTMWEWTAITNYMSSSGISPCKLQFVSNQSIKSTPPFFFLITTASHTSSVT